MKRLIGWVALAGLCWAVYACGYAAGKEAPRAAVAAKRRFIDVRHPTVAAATYSRRVLN